MSEAKRAYNMDAFCSQVQNEFNFSLRYERLKAFQVSGLARARTAPKSKHVVPSVLPEVFNSPKAGGAWFAGQRCGERAGDAYCSVPDSPERGQKGYRAAKKALTLLIHGKTVRCVQVGGKTPCDGRSPRKSRDRIVAQCFVGELDIAAEMVRSGNACDWQRFSDGYYRLDPTTCINPN